MGKRHKALVDYPETEETTALREEVRRINRTLASANLGYLGSDPDVDLTDRELRRYFTTSDPQQIQFSRCGRFFGGFWQRMNKEDRRQLRINGEPVVEVDFSAAFAHIAFAQVGASPPTESDVYAIPGLEGLPRRLVKAALNTFLFDTSNRRRTWPEDYNKEEWADAGTGEVFEGFPDGFTPTRVRKAMLAHYPALREVMGSGIGHHLMYLESEIMRRCLTEFHERGITGLPLHDALVVAQSEAPRVKALMEAMAIEVIGVRVPAKITPPTPPPSTLH
jgi:hypothetical protein